MNENELYVVKGYKFDNPLIFNIDFIKNSCFKDCYFLIILTMIFILIIEWTIILINLTMNLSMILNVQTSVIMEDLIWQLVVKAWFCMN